MRYKKALFIFRRDLRLTDNSALIAALNSADQVYTVFHFDDVLIKPQRQFANRWLYNCLNDLQTQLSHRKGELFFLQGNMLKAVREFIDVIGIEAVYTNRDYTPYARKRDAALQTLCEETLQIDFHSFADQLLLEPEEGLKKNGTPYTVFTPFFKQNKTRHVAMPQSCPERGFARVLHTCGLESAWMPDILERSATAYPDPIRHSTENLLADIARFHNYDEERDFPAANGTTRLSVRLKFGSCSIREAYHAISGQLGKHHGLIRQLYWRDFFTHIYFHFPDSRKKPFRKKYLKLVWCEDRQKFQRWCEGRTGFPIVDAGIRELASTGYMHNRVRMIVASFLVKDLQINWRWGEQFFADNLCDYDAALNNGNWQWVASTGCDAQPWFRVFNPWIQQKKFDPECEYIKKWLPELANVPVSAIHGAGETLLEGYHPPMVDHKQAVSITKQLYGACS